MPSTYTWGDRISQTTFTSTYDKRGQIEELVEQAKLANHKLHLFMQGLTQKVNNESGKRITYSRGPLKTRQRIAEKCGITNWDDTTTDITGAGVKTPLEVKDIARATIVFSTIAQMLAFRDFIYTTDEFTALKKPQFDRSPAVKDLWAKNIEDVYKDVKFFLAMDIDFKGRTIPHIVELQLNVSQMSRGKAYGHAFYNLTRLAYIQGEQRFVWDDDDCIIRVGGDIKGKIGDKLRTSITHCRSMAEGDQNVLLACEILSKFLTLKLRLLSTRETQKLDSKTNRMKTVTEHNVFANGTQPLVIRGGQAFALSLKNGRPDISLQGAQAWAIAYLSSFIWSKFTKFQNLPGVTGLASNIHAKR